MHKCIQEIEKKLIQYGNSTKREHSTVVYETVRLVHETNQHINCYYLCTHRSTTTHN